MLLVTSISLSLSFRLLDVEFSHRRSGWERNIWCVLLGFFPQDSPVLEFQIQRNKGTDSSIIEEPILPSLDIRCPSLRKPFGAVFVCTIEACVCSDKV
jgi:hypothetical protein